MKARIKAGLNKPAQMAFNDEVNRQLSEKTKEWYLNIDSLILFVLHEEFGFGKNRLKKFLEKLVCMNDELVDYYRLNDVDFICRDKLSRIGIDVKKINEEIINERSKKN